jgi:hypothetical protein
MNKQLIAVLVVIAAVLSLQGSTSAHELIKDDTAKTGVVIHITPDDDPVAGKASQIYFDFEQPAKDYSFTVNVVNASGASVNNPVTVTGQTIRTDYTFPKQGLYHIELTAQAQRPGVASLHYDAHQQVGRGLGSAKASSHTLAKVGLVLGIAVLAILVIAVTFGRRHTVTPTDS